jgi:mercuric ion binding protein
MKKLLLTTGLLFIAMAPAIAAETQYTLRVDGITCPFCISTSEKALKEIDGVKGVTSDLKEGTITVCADAEKAPLTDEKLTELFLEKGFTYKGMETAEQCEAL